MQNNIKFKTADLFYKTFNEESKIIEKLPISGSARTYFRIKSKNYSVIATYNTDKKENLAFLHLSKIFKQNSINVPEIYAEDIDNNIYLQEDLGDETLFDRTQKLRNADIFPDEIINLYKKAIEQLAELQIRGCKGIDYSVCYPRAAFDRQSIMWDLNYFKYNFLKYTGIQFDEQLLENDFNTLIDFLLKAETDFFLFRDFKSLNIMIHENEVYFIDYQGGRKGALQYDIASVLYEAKANIPEDIKSELLKHYIDYAGQIIDINKREFTEFYRAYILIRIMQAMGTYGYRGLFEKKQHYIDSILFRLKNLKNIISDINILDKMSELKRILKELPQSEKFNNILQKDKLTVTIKSFSYKRGIPYDNSGNGGGHVFDCRFINNPGKIEKYKSLCGKDKEVIDYLENLKETHQFFNSIKQIVSASTEKYISRKFKNLSVNFGCTGGQHRSVYFAERLSGYLKDNFEVDVVLVHTEGF
ncbi:MAG: phosphotransferase [Bacteroidales bacterium]|nr:phosphotransferase [Bacteroidales bacterium]